MGISIPSRAALWARYTNHTAIASMVVLPAVFYARALLDNGLLYGDAVTEHLPMWLFSVAEMNAGRFPWWNPYIYGGQPHAASFFSGVFYPVNLLFLALPPVAAANIVLLMPLSLCGLFVYLHLRDLSVTVFGAWVAGMIAALCAAMQAHLGHSGFTVVAAWFAAQLFFTHRLLVRRQLRYAWLLALATALLIVGGHPQPAVYALIAIALYVVIATLNFRELHSWPKRMLVPAASLAAGVGLASVLLVPALELTAQSTRLSADYSYFSQGSYPPLYALTLFAPWIFGGGYPPFEPRSWGPLADTGWEGIQYLGVGALPLMAAAALQFQRDERVRRFAILALCLFILAAGSFTPLHGLLFHVPFYGSFRLSARYSILWGPVFAVLIGIGLDEIVARRRGLRDMLLLSLASFCGVLAIGTLLTLAFTPQAFAVFLQIAGSKSSWLGAALWIPLGIWAAQLTTLFLWLRRRTFLVSLLAMSCIAVLVFVDLGAFGWYFRSYRPEVNILEPSQMAMCLASEPAMSLDQPAREANVELIQTPLGPCSPNFAMIERIPSVDGYDSLAQQRYLDWLSADGYGESVQSAITRRHAPVLDILGVRYLLAQSPKQASQQYGSLSYSSAPLSVVLSSRQTVRLSLGLVNANVLGMITWLGNGTEVQQGEVVAEIRLTLADGSTRSLPLLAGLHTAEWAWDRPSLKGRVLHTRAPIAYDSPQYADGYSGHAYLAEIPLGSEMGITSVEIASKMESASIAVDRVSLSDTVTHETIGVGTVDILRGVDSYRELSHDSGLTVFENIQALPRAWLVNSLEVMAPELVRDAVLNGNMPDGRLFDSSTVALAETPLANMKLNLSSSDYAQVRGYVPGRIELEVSSKTNAFLVVSESYYPGWIAVVDGQPADIVRTDYLLMGLRVPAGIHDVVLSYSPRIFALGAALSALTFAAFAVGSILYVRTQHGVPGARWKG
jgi:Bacterial membrane protein YfhO